VIRRLGAGGFATVWLGADDVLDAFVAIKVLADNWAHQPDIRDRFEQEARIMRRADSTRLVRVLDIGELPDGRPYLVMTFADGGTLADRLDRGPMPWPQALAIAIEIAHAVAVLHELGVLHRDLKPSNVLFDSTAGQERVLVTDLGLAKAIAHASGFTVAAGTPGYMAPEQARPGGGLDVRADVFAIGVVAYEMLTGRVPAAVNPPAPSKLRTGIPSNVDDTVLRALRSERRQRWPSAAALATALHRDLGPAGQSHRALGPAEQSHRHFDPAERSPRRRPRARYLIAAGVALVVALGVSVAALGWLGRSGAVRVSDATGDLSITVPSTWAGQLRDAGWDPAMLRLPAGHAPGLAVAADLTAWPDPASPVPGVFVGASRSLASGGPTPALPSHDACTPGADRIVMVDGNAARVRRWTACSGTATSFSETVFTVPQRDFGIYVQIKQVDGVDRTDSILGSLRIGDSTAPQAAGPVRPLGGPDQHAHTASVHWLPGWIGPR
jgi:hypothetical protein